MDCDERGDEKAVFQSLLGRLKTLAKLACKLLVAHVSIPLR